VSGEVGGCPWESGGSGCRAVGALYRARDHGQGRAPSSSHPTRPPVPRAGDTTLYLHPVPISLHMYISVQSTHLSLVYPAGIASQTAYQCEHASTLFCGAIVTYKGCGGLFFNHRYLGLPITQEGSYIQHLIKNRYQHIYTKYAVLR
jgi:hypothetical protein